MLKTVRFFKLTEGPITGWFADVTGHTLAENEMVAGSDAFLEEVDARTGGTGEVHLTLSDDGSGGQSLISLSRRAHNQWGATYILSGPLARQHGAEGFQLWICNVTHDVFGEHPRSIHIHGIR